MLQVKAEADRIWLGEWLAVSLQRTLRIPDDGREYPLPPGLGRFPVHRAADYAEHVPAVWKSNAVKVGVGEINTISGAAWDLALHSEPQDYMVCPPQPWLDGINAGAAYIRQFVAMPLGQGYTVESYLTGAERIGGIQIQVYEPHPGRFPDQPPVMARPMAPAGGAYRARGAAVQEMGIAAVSSGSGSIPTHTASLPGILNSRPAL